MSPSIRTIDPAHAWPPLGVECYAWRNSYLTPGNWPSEGNTFETEAEALDEAAANPTFKLLYTDRIRTVFEVRPTYLRDSAATKARAARIAKDASREAEMQERAA